jgi:hypothetical protein
VLQQRRVIPANPVFHAPAQTVWNSGHFEDFPIRELPIDPFTQQRDWVAHFGDTVMTPEQTGVDDVHSNSDQIGSDGTPYNTW